LILYNIRRSDAVGCGKHRRRQSEAIWDVIVVDAESIERADAPQSRVEAVYRDLRDAIIDGDYAPGSHLRLQELAATYGVSLIPVREAIRKLETERLVETFPNRGARVAEISAEDVADSYRARVLLETGTVRLAAANLDEAAIAEARSIMDRMVEAFENGDDAGGFDLHRDLHFFIYEHSESQWLVYVIEILWGHTERYRRTATPDPHGGEHAKMLDALAEGRIEAAVEALRIDLENTAAGVIDSLAGPTSEV
jgi:DNA-binding GntR family transcriptional regulator